MNKSKKKVYLGVGVFLVLSILLAGFFSGWFGLFEQSFISTQGSVSFRGVTYPCEDSHSLLSSDLQLAGCRLCFVEKESSSMVSGNTLLGDCVPWKNSAGDVRYRFEGVGIAKSVFHDSLIVRTNSEGRNIMSDDIQGYIDAAKDKFVDWSLMYDYCPVNGASFLVIEKLGACALPVVVIPPVVDTIVPPPIVSSGVPMLFWYIIGGLVVFVLIIVLLVKSKKGKR